MDFKGRKVKVFNLRETSKHVERDAQTCQWKDSPSFAILGSQKTACACKFCHAESGVFSRFQFLFISPSNTLHNQVKFIAFSDFSLQLAVENQC